MAAGFSTRAALDPWTTRVLELGSELVESRLELLAALEPGFEATADELGLPDGQLAYEGEPPTRASLEAAVERDLDRGTTGVGPHLHDVRIVSGRRDLRAFGSQGEQRVAVLALLLGEAALIADRRGYAPLLLLDDVLSELDPQRRRILVDRVRVGGQTLVTATTSAALPGEPSQLLEVRPGEVRAA
jgi:DNA replication and repair protein RecF